MPTHYQGTRKERAALDAFIKLVRSFQTVTDRAAPELEASGVSGSQFGVLEALYHLGPLCMKALAEKILRSSGNLTLVVRNLERDKLVTRKQVSDDRRYYVIELTEKGRKLIAELFPRHAAALVEAMSSLTIAEQEELARLCKKLGRGTSH